MTPNHHPLRAGVLLHILPATRLFEAICGRRQRAMRQQLIRDIEHFCQENGMAPSTFGALAVGNRAFVGRLAGRYGQPLDPRQSTVARIYDFMDRYESDPRMRPTV